METGKHLIVCEIHWVLFLFTRKTGYGVVRMRAACAVACLQVREKLVHAVDEIKEVMASAYRIFENDSEEVQREWVRYTQKVDKKMEDALRYTVKKSLQVRHRR